MELKHIEKELRTSATKGDFQAYFDQLGEAVVSITKKLIEIEHKIDLMADDFEKLDESALGAKERKSIERLRNSKSNLSKRVQDLETQFKNLGRTD